MSLKVRHLNGDATFLLLFSPDPHPTSSSTSFPTSEVFSILIDPWITGNSVVSAKWFAVTERVEPSAISHLSEIDEPDVVICSQNKPDHTHRETLLQLRPEARTIIAAEPGAAREIKSWNHFDPHRIVSLAKYDPKAKFGNSLRLYIPPLSPDGLPGEVVITFIPAKIYITGLHNAIGITYQAPTRSRSIARVPTVDLQSMKYFQVPLSPTSTTENIPPHIPSVEPDSPLSPISLNDSLVPPKPATRRLMVHRPQLSRSSNTASSELLTFPFQPSIQPLPEYPNRQRTASDTKSIPCIDMRAVSKGQVLLKSGLPTPPDSPYSPLRPSEALDQQSKYFTSQDSVSSIPKISLSQSQPQSRKLSISEPTPIVYPARPKVVSVLYTPHGIPTVDLRPYIQNHLVKLPGALPLTLLLHSFEYAQNPWYLGGNIMTGAPGGIEIAKVLMARCWISAHDEPKDKKGVSIKFLKQEQMPIEEVRRSIAMDESNRRYGWTCDVRSLSSGQELLLSGSERDLLLGSVFNTPIEAAPNKMLLSRQKVLQNG